MTPNANSAGGATVGLLNRVPDWEAALILHLRLWCAGPECQAKVWDGYAQALPREEVRDAMRAFDQLIGLIWSYAHRPLIRHALDCNCISLDEAVFARMVRTATDGPMQDALLMAALIVPPGYAEAVAQLAGTVGATARQITAPDRTSSPKHKAGNVVWLH
ncbi:hypothetical protein [Thalassococcus sp. S3]|uniref:hypothetical protein n=1 Tax=Thalassococcus sp. S3 TaxID=2017482 RepID=UPI0010244652|nr:hypothetical protein [Thalassococcus sp. S3]QBF30463.1 hypothetical protein CFI11_04445 [Thalassococcus sp. S3]